MQANSLHHNYSGFSWPFESIKCREEGKNSHKNEYFKKKTAFYLY